MANLKLLQWLCDSMTYKKKRRRLKMKLKNWVKWLLFDLVIADSFLIAIYLYALRIIEIGV